MVERCGLAASLALLSCSGSGHIGEGDEHLLDDLIVESCGNGVLDAEETCDPANTCPSSCEDGNLCTGDASEGSRDTCDLRCGHSPVVACAAGDQCCPSGCDSSADGDCSSTCGDGVVDANETCDPIESCPTTCDDGNACTLDGATGSEANCNKACTHVAISECADGDACCPAGCTSAGDADCSTACDDGVIDDGETCDPSSSCPTTCDDGNSCTVDLMTGSAATCSVACSVVPIVSCIDSDGCCPAGCTSSTDDDCSATCGDGTLDDGETCDPPSSCPTTCDDSDPCTVDTLSGSATACSAACTNTPISACASGDECCPSGCSLPTDGDCSPSCGDGIVSAGETCDPPGTCPTSCDDGISCTSNVLSGSASTCTAACTFPTTTTCTSGDGCCPSSCSSLSDGDCSAECGNTACEGNSGETCMNCGSDCDTTASVCGNGECQSGESSASCYGDCGPEPWPSEWRTYADEVIALFNAHRAAGTDCPTSSQAPVGPVTLDTNLRRAAELHSWDLSYSGYFAHESCNNRSPWDRAAAQGTSAGGEIIAGCGSTPESNVTCWMGSQGHCAIIMGGSYTRVGVGYASPSAHIWTGLFGW